MNSAAVTYLTLDEAPQKLWWEWLGGYFDGGMHEVGPSGTGAVAFPQASLSFEQAAIPQPLDGPNILVTQETIDSQPFLTESGKNCIDTMRWDFYIRAASSQLGKAEVDCRTTSQCLKALLRNDYALLPLTRKGLYDIAWHEAKLVQDPLYQLRRIRVTGRLNYSLQTVPTP